MPSGQSRSPHAWTMVSPSRRRSAARSAAHCTNWWSSSRGSSSRKSTTSLEVHSSKTATTIRSTAVVPTSRSGIDSSRATPACRAIPSARARAFLDVEPGIAGEQRDVVPHRQPRLEELSERRDEQRRAVQIDLADERAVEAGSNAEQQRRRGGVPAEHAEVLAPPDVKREVVDEQVLGVDQLPPLRLEGRTAERDAGGEHGNAVRQGPGKRFRRRGELGRTAGHAIRLEDPARSRVDIDCERPVPGRDERVLPQPGRAVGEQLRELAAVFPFRAGNTLGDPHRRLAEAEGRLDVPLRPELGRRLGHRDVLLNRLRVDRVRRSLDEPRILDEEDAVAEVGQHGAQAHDRGAGARECACVARGPDHRAIASLEELGQLPERDRLRSLQVELDQVDPLPAALGEQVAEQNGRHPGDRLVGDRAVDDMDRVEPVALRGAAHEVDARRRGVDRDDFRAQARGRDRERAEPAAGVEHVHARPDEPQQEPVQRIVERVPLHQPRAERIVELQVDAERNLRRAGHGDVDECRTTLTHANS